MSFTCFSVSEVFRWGKKRNLSLFQKRLIQNPYKISVLIGTHSLVLYLQCRDYNKNIKVKYKLSLLILILLFLS